MILALNLSTSPLLENPMIHGRKKKRRERNTSMRRSQPAQNSKIRSRNTVAMKKRANKGVKAARASLK